MSKYFDWKEAEKRIYDDWESRGLFAPEAERPAEPRERKFVMAMPPPNVTGALHMGHAMFVTIEDIMARSARLRGHDVLWIPGTDHAGIATQMVVERDLAQTSGISRAELGRDAFVDRVWEWKRAYGDRITTQLRRLGASCDWGREAFTLDAGLSRAVAAAFRKLHDDGLVYRGAYMVNWSPNLQTAVSDLEVEYSEEQGTLYHFRYPVEAIDGDGEGEREGKGKGKGGPDAFLPVATSRPETILGDTALAVNPEDARYARYIGGRARVPFTDRVVPIVADDAVAMDFGTGCLKVTPAHDVNDYKMGKKHGLDFVRIMNKDATLNGACGKYEGMDRFDAREAIWRDMEQSGMAIKTERYATRVPKSQRGGEVIEPMLSEQWFVRMEPLAAPALEAVREGSITLVPSRFDKIYYNWLENIQDWCISRQLWWGHRIPAWYVYASEEEARAGAASAHAGSPYVVAATEAEAYEEARKAHGSGGGGVFLVQEEDVLDTWFSSSLWPFSTLGWPDCDADDLRRFYPTTMMETGHDILFFWVARMIMMGIRLTGDAPFHTVYLHGLIRDQEGRKMSKTLGNVIDPLDVIDEYGTDALRFTLATGTTPGQDLNLSLEKIEASRNLVNKIWNAGKFITACLGTLEAGGYTWSRERSAKVAADLSGLPFAERWILSELSHVVALVDKSQRDHSIGEAGRALYAFFWGQLADWYLEISKTRLYSENKADAEQCMDVLMHVYLVSMQLLHPFMPFVTEEIWQTIVPEEGSISTSSVPSSDALASDEEARAAFGQMQAAVRAIRNVRQEQQVPINKQISASLSIASEALKQLVLSEEKVLKFLCKIEDVAVIDAEVGKTLSTDDYIEAVVSDGFCAYIPLAGLVDAEQEMSRLKRQTKKIEKDLATLNQRLESKSFVQKAPAKVVQETTSKRDDLVQQLEMVRNRLGVLASTSDVSV